MKKIQPFLNLFGRMTHAEHFDTIEAIIAYIDPKAAGIPGLASPWAAFKNCFSTEDEYFKMSQKQPGTDEIVEADNKRDESLMDLKRTVDFYTYSKTETISQAARQIMFVLNIYKNASKESYTKNSALVTNLIDDLRKEQYSQAVQTLEITALIDTLEEDNNTFKELYRLRSKEVYSLMGEKLNLLRRNTDLAFETVAECLNGFYVNNLMNAPTAALTLLLEDIIQTVNSYLTTADTNLKRHAPSYRKGGGGGTSPDPDPDPGPDPGSDEPLLLVLTGQKINDPIYDEQMNSANTLALYFENDQNYIHSVFPVISECRIQLRDKDNVMHEFRQNELFYGGVDQPSNGFGMTGIEDSLLFKFPFEGIPTPYPGEIVKDGKKIAYFENVLFPALFAEQ